MVPPAPPNPPQVRGTDSVSPHGIPVDLLDRLVIVRTQPHSLAEMVQASRWGGPRMGGVAAGGVLTAWYRAGALCDCHGSQRGRASEALRTAVALAGGVSPRHTHAHTHAHTSPRRLPSHA